MLSRNGLAFLSSFSSSFAFLSSLLMGTEGTDGESSSPYCPSPLALLFTSPLPWCLCLNYISALASTATLFTHSSIHIHLACTCLVSGRVTWRESTHKTYAQLRTNTDQLTHICSGSPLRWWGSRRAIEMSERRRGNKDIRESKREEVKES